ncbi:MAG: hypothetical protein H7Z10_11325 [Gemmatimonadaceae bacterium]|nr:hypothetical protein [Acetobacteraceae bacterium]
MRFLAVGALAAGLLVAPAHAQQRRPAHDYPTAARADYVIGCMATSGFKREYLERCACGIDTIADTMSYEDYESADTIVRMQQGGLGERAAMFRDTPVAKERTEQLRRAQAEVALQCK